MYTPPIQCKILYGYPLMTAQVIDGKAIATQIRHEIKHHIAQYTKKGLRQPTLAVILLGNDPASAIYVQNKHQACEAVGIHSLNYSLSPQMTQQELINTIQQLNQDQTVDGILLQLPLPPHIDSDDVLEHIHPDKDVDGFHPFNLGRLAQGRPVLRPCTPFGVMTLLDSIGQPYQGKHAVIIGASNIVGKPMALELLKVGCTITLCHSQTVDILSHIATADILVSAVGKPGMIKGNAIKPNATVIDVGITRLPNGTITGDVEFASACQTAKWITPVPGGVGPMTVASLLKNTMTTYRHHHDL